MGLATCLIKLLGAGAHFPLDHLHHQGLLLLSSCLDIHYLLRAEVFINASIITYGC